MKVNDYPMISVIMNCYNSSHYLREAIESVINQTYENWEIIFWDNQSTDDSAEIYKSFNDSRLKYFYAPEHTTLGAARKLAIKKAKGDFFGILDCDDVWSSKKLMSQLFRKPIDSQVGVIYSDFDIISSKSIKKRKSLRPSRFKDGYLFDDIFKEKITICWPTVLFNRKVFDDVGSFRDFKYLEDYDILLRIAHKYKFIFIDEKLASYRVHVDQESINYTAMLNEKLKIHSYWNTIWNKSETITKDKINLLIEAKSRAYFIAGLNAIHYGNNGFNLFLKSIKLKFKLYTFFLLILSLFGSKFSVFIISNARKMLGYSEYFN